MTDGPILWYLNRGTGVVVLVLLTHHDRARHRRPRRPAGRGLPRFVTQALHRNLALLSVVLLAAHVVSAVVDEYVDIRWWQAFVPFGATYEPLWLGLGAVALDLIAGRGADQPAPAPDAAPGLAAAARLVVLACG